MDIPPFVYPFILFGYLGCLHLFAIMNNAAEYLLFLCINGLFSKIDIALATNNFFRNSTVEIS